ncbi:MAG: hypothetical protein K2Q09_11620 [Phycisphaerales bacterium]|nr:hypothetical protein [Phycisphaerales bacterium]
MLRTPPRVLTRAERETVSAAIIAHCAVRRWQVLAQNPRSNHVDAVIGAGSADPKKVLQELKSWSTRYLKQLDASFTDPWTRGGSARSLFSQEDVAAAVYYATVKQERPGRFRPPSSGPSR